LILTFLKKEKPPSDGFFDLTASGILSFLPQADGAKGGKDAAGRVFYLN